ncbi:hypothetical protein ACFODZ_03895 [Marinicella sediminis]|uniref:DUF3558 domain-containing protein n=2 Tax=Marinicella sediminis TaxID=1792834 RepID=A0ABV7J8B0_9GAMM
MRHLLNIPVRVLAIGGFMFMAACSDADQSSQTSTAVPAKAIAESAIVAAQLDLSTTAINQPMFLGQVVPEVQAAMPCPFLSDEQAMAIIKSKRELKRRNTSNTQCYWSMNAGFSVKLTLEPLATAKPVQQRSYNMDSPPVLKPQAGPGNNATILYDTVWDKERAYAMSFEQGQQLVMIYVTGMATDAELLTTAAETVSAQMQAGASLEPQAERTDEFNMCSIWSETEIAAIIGSPVSASSGKLECKWSSESGDELTQIRVNVSYGKNHTWDYLREIGGVDVPGIGEGAMLNKMRKKGNRPGHVVVTTLYADSLVNVSVTDNIADFNGVAVALAENIGSRF